MAKFEDYVTTKEAAEIVGITPAGMVRKAALGQLDAFKRGGVWWFSRESVEHYAQAVAGKSRHDPTRGREQEQPE